MKKVLYFRIVMISVALLVLACRERSEKAADETILTGSTTIVLDEAFLPIVEDVATVFESDYNAKITLKPTSEAESVNMLINQSVSIAILSRQLDSAEINLFKSKKIIPRQTKFGSDAIALIRSRESNDSLLDPETLRQFIRGNDVKGIDGLVFDNVNSGAARQLMEFADVASLPQKAYSFKTNLEVIRYVAHNRGMVGVVGLNWLSQPSPEVARDMKNIEVLKIKNIKGDYVRPSQNALAEGNYPLARDLFLVNCQGFQGLGMGFASFIAGERGQRIILKSGLLPVRIPGRKIITRPAIIKNTNN